ncbi:MAG: electron transport complex subunit E [Candidatus Wallbacteria bacterium]|nr:electron transport complex subunit E [Candidatus Wallbacteria bacterium]
MSNFTKGIFEENPVFRLVLGMCPTLAVTSSAENGMGMGLASTFVLTGSSLIISMLRKVIPPKIRIPVFLVVIATFVTITDLCMAAYLPDLHRSLGIFIPLIVVNCIVIGRAEAFAFKSPVLPSLVDALGMGCGFTAALTLLGSVRETLGNGTIFNIPLFGSQFEPAIMMILPPGAFLTLGLLLGYFNYVSLKKKERRAC